VLSHILIRDLAIVSQVELDLGPGMTALTGETGAGKSIVIDALGLTLGDKADAGLIRLGAERAEVTASFALDGLETVQGWLEEQDLAEGTDCAIRRLLPTSGRTRAYINGHLASTGQLQTLGELLVDIHGQHAHQSLLRPAAQRELLDEYAGHMALAREVASAFRDYHVLDERRINARPPETTTDYRDYIAARKLPVISHEIGQWCVYPNFAEMRKYTGYLKPRNFEIFRDLLDAHGLSPFARPFLLASGKLQTLCYKEDIESALRTPGMAGFELLDLHDFPGQGTALVGVLDPFWESKGYVSAAEFARFCGPTTPLARLPRRVVTVGDPFEVTFEAAHYGPERTLPVQPVWRLTDAAGRIRATGSLSVATLERGKVNSLGRVNPDFSACAAPSACRLVLRLEPTQGRARTKTIRAVENDWNLWVYPPATGDGENPGVLVTSRFDAAAEERLKAGGRVLLTIPGAQVRNHESAPVALGFSSIFWNTAWTGRQPPTTLGILCDPKHPALAGFPTAFHSDWQWWYLVHRAGALRLDLLPRGMEPIVRVIDDWFTARPLGLVVEGRVGPGRIVVCGFDLTAEASDPVSRQMRRSLTTYMGGPRFHPATEFTLDQVKQLTIAKP